jgi:anti-sigma B factor antagonist
MQIETNERDGVAIVSIEGEIDSKTAPDAQGQLLPYVEEHTTMVMDLSKLTFMSSAGLRMMLLLYRHATAKNGKVALVGLSEQIKDTMDATGFLSFFELSDSVDAAITAVKG